MRRWFSVLLILVLLSVSFPADAAALAAPANTAVPEQPGDTPESQTAAASYYKVTSTTLNLRKSPSASSKVVARLTKNTVLVRLNTRSYSGSGTRWYRVRVYATGKTGYVAYSYVKKVKTPNFSRLESLALSPGKMFPAFSQDTLKYTYYLADSANGFSLSYTPRSKKAAVGIQVGETAYAGNPVAVAFENGAKLAVTVSASGKRSVYEIAMLREDENASRIKTLSLKGVEIAPAFDPQVREYTASVPYKTIDTSAVVKKFNKHATITYIVDGKRSSENFLPLMVGDNDFSIECKSPLGKKSTYCFHVERAEPAPGEEPVMSALERRILETAFSLLPFRHPFVLAYERATGRNIKSYIIEKNGKRISGVPFEYGGSGNVKGFSSRWWDRTGVRRYPVGGMDCAEFIHWVYNNVGYDIPESSSGIFLSGVEGVTRSISGVKKHKVIPSLKDAKIGDVAYNSKTYGFRSGHGNHSSLFIGTARKIGIADTIRKYYPKFPVDAYLVIDIGWADGRYYYNMTKRAGLRGRSSLCGVGIQFFTSIKGNNGKYIYKSPYKKGTYTFSWYDKKSKQTFRVSANLERNRRPYQYKPSASSKVKYVMNLSRPIKRND